MILNYREVVCVNFIIIFAKDKKSASVRIYFIEVEILINQ